MKFLGMIAALIVTLSIQSQSFAQGPRGDGNDRGQCMGPCGAGHGMHSGMEQHRGGGEGFMEALDDLDLSNDQIDKIKSSREEAHKQNIPLRGQIELKEIEIREMMNGDKPDREKVSAKIKEMESIKSQMRVNRTNAHIDMLNVLTKEQRDKLDKETFGRGFGKKKMKRFLED